MIDRLRPRLRDDTLTTNHGGVAIVGVSGIRLSPVDFGCRPSTIEQQCIRILSGLSACVVALAYRPDSVSATSAFYTEFADMLDRLATFVDPICVVGDINMRLE